MADTNIGERLKLAREKCKLKQVEVCKKLDIPKPQSLSAYEKGVNSPPIELLKKMAMLYQVTTDWILFGEDNPVAENRGTVELIKDLILSTVKLGIPFYAERDWNNDETGKYAILLTGTQYLGIDELALDLYRLSDVQDVLGKDDYETLVMKKIESRAKEFDNFPVIQSLPKAVPAYNEELPF